MICIIVHGSNKAKQSIIKSIAKGFQIELLLKRTINFTKKKYKKIRNHFPIS